MMETVGLILHFRSEALTLRCLQSLRDEGIAAAVLVDNSEDSGCSIDRMQAALSALRDDGFDVRVRTENRNLGFAAGVEFGLDYIRREFKAHVLLLNSDAVLLRGSLRAMQDMLESSSCIAPMISNRGREVRSPFSFYDPMAALILEEPRRRTIRHASGCCLLFREDLASAPLFDTQFFFYGDDIKLAHDFAQRGIETKLCEAAVVEHLTSSSSGNGSLFYEYHLVRAHWKLAASLARGPAQMAAYVLARCLTLPTRAAVRSLRLRSALPWKGLVLGTLDALRGRWRSLTPPPSS